MTIRVLTCWALCAALVSADDKKAEEPKKPATAAEAVEALKTARVVRARTVQEFIAGQEKAIAAADAVLAIKDANGEQKELAVVAKAGAFAAMLNYKPDAAKDFEAFAKMVEADHPKSAAIKMVDTTKFSVKHMGPTMKKIDPKAMEDFGQLVKKYPGDKTFAGLCSQLATKGERAGDAKGAEKVLEEGIKLFPDDQRMPGMLRGMKVMGNPMEIVGPTLEGSEFNIASLKGKVVLVDFWAVWCGPCIRELPHVKAAYKKFHDQGFEIVGVSLDRERSQLENFIKKEEMPWTQIIFSKPEEMWWKNPVAVKYGINGIPATYLIGRDGKVVKRNIPGRELEKVIAAELAKSQKVAN